MQHVTMRNFNVAEAARHSQRLQLLLAEVENEGCHELVILLWVHPLLEVGESSGEYHRFLIPIVCTCLVLAASGRIDQTQILCILLHHHGVGYLM